MRRLTPWRSKRFEETIMTTIAASATKETRSAGVGRIALASLVGTTIEFYDFYIFGTAAALVFGPMFFPKSAPETQTLNAYLTFGIAFLARPVGSFLFGHFGDRVGRKSTLVATMITMGLATTLIGALPSYASAGAFAPWALAALRFLQGVGLGGEWGGAALIAVENAPEGRRAWYGMFPQLGPPIGFLIATGLFLLLLIGFGEAAFVDWAWRVPFLLSAVLVAIGLYVRVSLEETLAFKALDQDQRAAVPLTTILRDHPGALIQGSLAIVVCYALFYIATVYALGYGVRSLGIPRVHFLGLLCGAVVFMALATPLSAALADRFGRRPVLMSFAVVAILVGLAMPRLMSGGAVGVFAFLRWRWARWGSPSRRLARCCQSSFRFPSATPARPAPTISAASSAPRSLRRSRRFSRRAAASPGSAITSRSPARSVLSRS
jgi:MFS family permease